ncbi:hypothetical protein GPECTOR_1g435 [Gonium pectorale]|uniref:Protein kinase domain-containing protein n=1 Tax=Gonium pectorale TaxID=33097 RepID=A0A150H2T4_GONPE|nr:hypothetical protein GPECTOR_1g435 [Gonium pectorale]|eukprot:KXZ56486.1 hypothetical protein GPECTOR_1g435 [Gonium pectorale]
MQHVSLSLTLSRFGPSLGSRLVLQNLTLLLPREAPGALYSPLAHLIAAATAERDAEEPTPAVSVLLSDVTLLLPGDSELRTFTRRLCEPTSWRHRGAAQLRVLGGVVLYGNDTMQLAPPAPPAVLLRTNVTSRSGSAAPWACSATAVSGADELRATAAELLAVTGGTVLLSLTGNVTIDPELGDWGPGSFTIPRGTSLGLYGDPSPAKTIQLDFGGVDSAFRVASSATVLLVDLVLLGLPYPRNVLDPRELLAAWVHGVGYAILQVECDGDSAHAAVNSAGGGGDSTALPLRISLKNSAFSTQIELSSCTATSLEASGAVASPAAVAAAASWPLGATYETEAEALQLRLGGWYQMKNDAVQLDYCSGDYGWTLTVPTGWAYSEADPSWRRLEDSGANGTGIFTMMKREPTTAPLATDGPQEGVACTLRAAPAAQTRKRTFWDMRVGGSGGCSASRSPLLRLRNVTLVVPPAELALLRGLLETAGALTPELVPEDGKPGDLGHVDNSSQYGGGGDGRRLQADHVKSSPEAETVSVAGDIGPIINVEEVSDSGDNVPCPGDALLSYASSADVSWHSTTAISFRRLSFHGWEGRDVTVTSDFPPDAPTAIQDFRAELQSESDTTVRLLKVIGRGSYGCVHLGVWRNLPVAVKVLVVHDTQLGAEGRTRQRAVLEAAVGALLDHPNVVATYAYDVRPLGEQPGDNDGGEGESDPRVGGSGMVSRSSQPDVYQLRILQEFCSGGSLKELLGLRGTLGAGALAGGVQAHLALHLAFDVAAGLRHVHAAGIVHGDVSAGNVLLARRGSTNGGRLLEGDPNCVDASEAEWRSRLARTGAVPGVVAKVSDFGLSVRLAESATHASGLYQGTPVYTSPEVFLFGRVSRASDVYSFGVLLLELMHGMPVAALWEAAVPRVSLSPPAFADHGLGASPLLAVLRNSLNASGIISMSPVRALLEACLATDPAGRPTMEQAAESLVGCAEAWVHQAAADG